jgi:mono/diheme cytochrome c family protein
MNFDLMKAIFKYTFLLMAAGVMFSCNDDPKNPGYEYMPDMYRSPDYETNSINPLFADSMTDRQPVAGTVARGNDVYTAFDRLPYPYANDSLGYETAGRELHNPLEKTPENMAEGKRLFENYCSVCHGSKGQGDGPVPANNGPKPPSYSSDQLKNLPEGKAFHTTEYGKNNMGSYASQLVATQRWKIIMYVQTLQHPETAASPDSAKKKITASK